MTELLLPFITNEFWLQILRFLLGSTLLLGTVALVIRLGFLRQYRLQSTMWKAAVLASLLLLLPIADSLLPTLTLDPLVTQDSVNGNAEVTPGLTTVMSPGTNNATARFAWLPTVSILALLLWVAISGSALLKLLFSHYRVMRTLGPRQEVDPFTELRKTFAAQCRRASIHPLPRLTVSRQITSPMTLTRREVCLPGWMVDSMSAEDVSCVIAHELGHIKHRDLLLAAVMHVVVCVFFFQPLLRVARNQLLDLAEFIADQEAVDNHSNVEQVASVLISCADRLKHQPDKHWGFAMVGNTSRLRSRIEQILGRRQSAGSARQAVLHTLLTVGLLGSVFLIPNLDSGQRASAAAMTVDDAGVFEPVACTVAGYESIVDQVHSDRVSPQAGLSRWEHSCGKELGREVDSLWQQNKLPDHHLWYMANGADIENAPLSPVMAALYRVWATKQALSEKNQAVETAH